MTEIQILEGQKNVFSQEDIFKEKKTKKNQVNWLNNEALHCFKYRTQQTNNNN